MKKDPSVTGFNIGMNCGEDSGQTVGHAHVHLIPRRDDDGFDVPLPFHGSAMPDRTLLDAMAARIIAELRDPVRRSRPARRVATA